MNNPTVMRAYATYIEDIENDKALASDMLREADEIEQARAQRKHQHKHRPPFLRNDSKYAVHPQSSSSISPSTTNIVQISGMRPSNRIHPEGDSFVGKSGQKGRKPQSDIEYAHEKQ